MKGIVICSGGMDSVTLAHMLAEHDDIHLLSFTYGQKHVKELTYAVDCATELGVNWDAIDLSQFGQLIEGGSALTNPNAEVPEGHYAAENMKDTVVPNRNMIMLSLAVGVAVAKKADYVATGVHGGDHFIYPDCRPAFIEYMNRTVRAANEGFVEPSFHIQAPFIYLGKHDIVGIGSTLDKPVDFSKTWSCYNGRELHCGKCGTCVERKEAFQLAGVEDPTEYEA